MPFETVRFSLTPNKQPEYLFYYFKYRESEPEPIRLLMVPPLLVDTIRNSQSNIRIFKKIKNPKL